MKREYEIFMVLSEIQKLNTEQQVAVTTCEGRVLILAGAGSGKTKVLTVRMAYLIDYKNIHPTNILGLTFTNKAAAEMRHRVASLLDEKRAKQVTLCTFHSFCMQILRKEIEVLGFTKNFSLYDEYDTQRMIQQIVRDLLKHESTLPSLGPFTLAINQARNQGIAPKDLETEDNLLKEVYTRFSESMKAYNAVDFDNLLFLTVRLFKEHPDVLERYQDRYPYIMIDEYQDTNKVQFELASLLAGKHKNLCVVGDDDQSIYGWRGADVRNILEFENTKMIKLEQNYRSSNIILQAANAVIKNNTSRHDKSLWSEKEGHHLIEVFHAPTDIQEAEAVVYRIAKLREEKNLKWKDIAILYRSNALSRAFEMALLKYTWKDRDQWVRGIPYQIHGGEEYFERREVKDLMAYLRVIINPQDQEALLRIINLPRRGIGDDSLEKITSYNRSKGISLWQALFDASHLVSDSVNNSIHLFTSFMLEAKDAFKHMPLAEATQWLIDKIDFRKAIEEEVKSDKMRAFKWENVEEFINALKEYEESSEEPSLHDFITSTPLGKEKAFQKQKNVRDDQVSLMTFHSSKGLEFTACFLIAVEDEIIPHEKSMRETGIEEERRLMYVAITRAKEYLTLSMARSRKRMGKELTTTPSRFLTEIPKELLKATQWDH